MAAFRTTEFLRTLADDTSLERVPIAVHGALRQLRKNEFRMVADELLNIAETCALSGCAEIAAGIARAVAREARAAAQRWGSLGAFAERARDRARAFQQFTSGRSAPTRLLAEA